MKGTKKNLVRLYLYMCVVCVCQYMCEFYYVFEYVKIGLHGARSQRWNPRGGSFVT